ncbi:unnamed protein product [Ranitomeya imitator]|uniref:Uncharacterized protein n=1 Tax=Ranitomeya imitator TaxID=111125 RepID=A0ABN9KPS8_9NEOB|nr:unnamed protein product [Ranitomeya imitator]
MHRISLSETLGATSPLSRPYCGRCRMGDRSRHGLRFPLCSRGNSTPNTEYIEKSTSVPLHSTQGNIPFLQCAQFANVLKGPSISHPQTGVDIPFFGFFTCDSKQVVYAIKCPCGMIYAVKDRISHHKSDIRCKKNHLPVPYNFNTAGHSIAQLQFFVLEQISMNRRGGDVTQKILAREAYWIHFLQSMEPRGLNRDFDVVNLL